MKSFIITCYSGDWAFVEDLLLQVRTVYGDSVEIVVLSDGATDARLQNFCSQSGAKFYGGKRLKHLASPLWSRRLFRVALEETTGDYVCHLDADVLLLRALTLPALDYFDLCATLRPTGLISSCAVYSRVFMMRTLRSEAIRQSWTYKPTIDAEMHSHDKLLYAAAQEMRAVLCELPNSGVRWKVPPADYSGLDVVHPRLDSIPLLGQHCLISAKDFRGDPICLVRPLAQELLTEHLSRTKGGKPMRKK